MALFLQKSLKGITYNALLNSCSSSILIPFKISNTQVCKKHWNQQYRNERAKKVLKIILPDLNDKFKEKLSVGEIRSILKEKGVVPHRDWKEKPMYISCTGSIADCYIPPKGDGKLSFISEQGVKELFSTIEVKGKSYLALRKIRNIDLNFDVPTLAEKGREIYINAQKALEERNEDKLHDLVTEKAFVEMMEAIKLRTIRWKFIQSLEPPKIVHIRCQEMISADNIFAQVTMRLFSQQKLAVYDRFGRLIHGSEDMLKDVLEYIVFEKHITNPHGSWKIHGKIFPDLLPTKSLSNETLKTRQKQTMEVP